jgi:hypothetical protein
MTCCCNHGRTMGLADLNALTVNSSARPVLHLALRTPVLSSGYRWERAMKLCQSRSVPGRIAELFLARPAASGPGAGLWGFFFSGAPRCPRRLRPNLTNPSRAGRLQVSSPTKSRFVSYFPPPQPHPILPCLARLVMRSWGFIPFSPTTSHRWLVFPPRSSARAAFPVDR